MWDKPAKPYLRSVADSGYCSWSKYHNWKETYTAEQLKLMIEQYLSSEKGKVVKIGDILNIHIRSRTVGGRILTLVVETTGGSYNFGTDRIRWVFRRASNPELILQSARFDVEITQDNRGRLKKAVFKGGGYGHGVGMCQCGAIGMSRSGWKYQDILAFYYKNIDLVKLY